MLSLKLQPSPPTSNPVIIPDTLKNYWLIITASLYVEKWAKGDWNDEYSKSWQASGKFVASNIVNDLLFVDFVSSIRRRGFLEVCNIGFEI